MIFVYLGKKTYDVEGKKYERFAFINPYTDKVYNIAEIQGNVDLKIGSRYVIDNSCEWDFNQKGIKFKAISLCEY